ncbi:MAG TPA: M14 family metallopeptidase, partial [Candidatus Eisenbacteria bacterium]
MPIDTIGVFRRATRALLVLALGFASPVRAADPATSDTRHQAGPAMPGATVLPRLAAQPAVSLAEVELSDPAAGARLAELGLDVVEVHAERFARVFLWPGDEAVLENSGLVFRVVDRDYARTITEAAERGGTISSDDTGRTPSRDYLAPSAVPAPGSGSFGGWYTLAEVNAFLDSLVTTYPGLCDTMRIGTSRQGRPIRALRITDEGQPNHSRPRVLYTSLTHAREPGGMQALVDFMTRLIQGYGSDPDLTYLVNARELWFVPVVNPDGYEYNRTTWVNSGSFGLWRKNLRDNNGDFAITSADGVDINRNFGYRWGYDNIGSSGIASNQTYRGPSAFSEPETRALRDFSIAHGFTTADNYHTAAELCLYPWGYIVPACPDSTFLTRMSEEMQTETGYTYGTGGDVLYTVNGDANDWMYGEQVAKPKVFSVTIEAGDDNDGFWPPASRIVPLARQQFRANVVMAYSAGTWVHADTATIVTGDGWWHPGNWADVAVRLRNDGVAASSGAVS